jgi:2-keto-4-pentenoate hydratase
MLAEHAAEAARLLCEARAAARPLTELPASCRPHSDADAYQIQDAVTARLGETIGGWKVRIATITGAALCAPIFARMIRPSPAAYAASELRLIGVEAVLAFRLGRDLPARAEPYNRAETIDGASLHPAVEIFDSRYADFRAVDRVSVLADNASNGGLVYGAAIPDWQALDLVRTRINVSEDGKTVAESGRTPPRDAVAALIDFANLASHRSGAKAGMVVAVMPWTPLHFTERGKSIAADFGPLGRIEIGFPGGD